MGAPSKKRLGDDVMGAPSKAAVVLALTLALCIAALPAIAKPVKKGLHGAIALEPASGLFGYGTDAATARVAKVEALKQCADPRCEVVLNFSNACGALARSAKKYFTATGATRSEAETRARRLCAAKDCEVLVWACTR